MRFLFIMDPMEGILTLKDTTFSFMLGAAAREHEVIHALPLDLWADRGEVHVKAARVHVSRTESTEGKPHDTWRVDAPFTAKVADFDAVLIRNDPPFNANYAYMTQLLELARGRTLIVNDPQGLRNANEKLYSLHFSKWTPRTMVTASPSRVREFITEVGGQGVIKPLDGMAGAGVFLLRTDDRNFNAIVEARIGELGTTYCMVQEYLPAARQGDKRILLIDGEPLGAILRVPRDDEARANIHTGGTVAKVGITDEERAMIADLAPKLREDGLYFVGLDVIGGKLTEVNVTSPTGIQQMNRLDGIDYTARVIDWIERKVKSRRP